jgi:hypothetical protein
MSQEPTFGYSIGKVLALIYKTVRCSKSCQVVNLTNQNSQNRAEDARDYGQCSVRFGTALR